MDTTTYSRRPFDVEVVEVTSENLEEVAEWTNGKIEEDEHGRHVRVPVNRAFNARQRKAYPDDRVLYNGVGFKVYTPNAFERNFEKKEESVDILDGGSVMGLEGGGNPGGGDHVVVQTPQE